MKTMKLNIDLGKYVITGTKHDLILSERGIIKEGENAGKETLSRIGYYSKFEHLVKELFKFSMSTGKGSKSYMDVFNLTSS